VQGAVGVHDEPPAAGEGLEPVVAAAEAAEVRAVGLPAAGVRDDVVVVGPATRCPQSGKRQVRSRTSMNADWAAAGW
jgi:hypothetical protein